ncbi:hypothetical protein EJB05_28432 [Eragrostis curvula]|uniref:Carboxypeptidase n=1 Tax=Eragrostis curvula TaxID=38414 RepID=A0A5J9URK5_9POAL|nr:hypothetical protein EJB05_28432 [Eragrostis curvula]
MATNARTTCHSISWLLLLLSAWCLFVQGPVSASALVVTHLPGFDGPLPFSLETGYIEVDESNGVNLFYYFVQSEQEPSKDPVLLWLQGGPGCSGLSGLVYEIGPFLFDVQGYKDELPRLLYRPETWTKVSNIIFVDSPVGAGFSYASSKEGHMSSDTIAIKQLVIFLNKWMKEHPQFVSNSLYIGGESYSGIVIPSLVLEMDKLIRKESFGTLTFNLKGYIAGNPSTDKQYDIDGTIKFYHGMGLISDELFEAAKENCQGRYDPPANAQCSTFTESIRHCTKDVNVFHILEPSCESVWGEMAVTDEMRRDLQEARHNDLHLSFKCRSASYVLSHIWANNKTVRERLGIRQGTIGEWKRCNRVIPYDKDIQSTLEHHLWLRRKGYQALIYSGDHDSAVSFVGTQPWIRSFNLSITDDWRPWHIDGQVCGFTRSYSSNLTYATVKDERTESPRRRLDELASAAVRALTGVRMSSNLSRRCPARPSLPCGSTSLEPPNLSTADAGSLTGAEQVLAP